jgi:hypothetical protein
MSGFMHKLVRILKLMEIPLGIISIYQPSSFAVHVLCCHSHRPCIAAWERFGFKL